MGRGSCTCFPNLARIMDSPFPPEIVYATSTEKDGNMLFRLGAKETVLANREAFLARQGLKLSECVSVGIEHGDRIHAVGKEDWGRGAFTRDTAIPCDALVTNTPGTILFLNVADCLPVAFIDPPRKAIALVHVSRKNAGMDLIEKLVSFLHEHFQSVPKDLIVDVGPAIQKKSYLFPRLVEEEFPGWGDFVQQQPDGQFAIDLAGFTLQQLLDAGIRKEHLTVSPIDTAAPHSGYFSHYRDTRAGVAEGRFATILSFRPPTTGF